MFQVQIHIMQQEEYDAAVEIIENYCGLILPGLMITT